jgi:cell wall-associated NlpC family hydrolase
VAKIQLGLLAAETYKRGDLTTLDLMLSDDPQDVLAQAGYLPSLTERSAGAAKRLSEGERRLALTEAEIATQEREAAKTKRQLKASRETVDRKLAQAEAELKKLKAKQRAELKARLAAQEAVSAAAVDSAGGGSGGGSGTVDGTVSASCKSILSAVSGKVWTAIRFACAQLGEPYQWGAAGPGSWDCSGLTMRAWQAAGISLPHSSRMQTGYGTRVSASSLRAGDLVFFGSPVHHVGIYAGGGLMIHAPHTGDVVRIAPLYQTPSVAVRLV